jgi:hypothetical protein
MRSVLTPCSEIHFPNLPPPYLRDESHNLLYMTPRGRAGES